MSGLSLDDRALALGHVAEQISKAIKKVEKIPAGNTLERSKPKTTRGW